MTHRRFCHGHRDLLINRTCRIVASVTGTRTYLSLARDASSFLSRAQRPTDHLHVTHRRFCHGHRDLLINRTCRIVASVTGTRTYLSLARDASSFLSRAHGPIDHYHVTHRRSARQSRDFAAGSECQHNLFVRVEMKGAALQGCDRAAVF